MFKKENVAVSVETHEKEAAEHAWSVTTFSDWQLYPQCLLIEHLILNRTETDQVR